MKTNSSSEGLLIRSSRNGAVVVDRGVEALGFFQRLRGLIGKRELGEGEGMLFPRCNDIHMWFMSIPIDVVFLKTGDPAQERRSWKVSSVHPGVRPWRVLPLMDLSANDTLELPAGTIRRCDIQVGDELKCTS